MLYQKSSICAYLYSCIFFCLCAFVYVCLVLYLLILKDISVILDKFTRFIILHTTRCKTMARGAILKNNFTKETLLKIAEVGLFIIAASNSPYFLNKIVTKYFRDRTKQMAYKRARKLRELQKRKLIEFREVSDGSIKITLSHLGKTVIRHYKLEEMEIQKPRIWDRQWRLVMYDIPHKQRLASNALREKLKRLGLYQLQKSIWVSPYPCLAELEFLCAVFEINMDEYIYYFEVTKIPREKELKKFFSL
mgnify:CR=1 FL=1